MKNIVLAIIIFPSLLFSQNINYEGYYLYQNTYPTNEAAFWFPQDTEVQGVTNDGEDWFITTTGHEDASGITYWGKLWRIPKEVPLGDNSTSHPEVDVIDIINVPELNISGNPYWHWGDPDHYEYNNKGYILVPIYPKDGNDNGIIACFQIDPFEFKSFGNLPFRPGWCAIDNNGYLYSSNHTTNVLKKFEVDWEALTTSDNHDVLNNMETILLTFNGNNYNELIDMQGGEFSGSSELLYLVSGGAGCAGFGSGVPEESDGIHVFTTNTWTEIETSHNGGEHHFLYQFDNGCEGVSPEGLTIWDLDDGSVDQFAGKLHVLIFNWEAEFFFGGNDHLVSMHHFSNKIHLDSDANIILQAPHTGSLSQPFQNLNDANSFYPLWDGAELIFKAGEYNGSNNSNIIINKKVKMTSTGGSTIIGN